MRWPWLNGSKYAPVPGSIPGTALNLRGVEVVLAPLCLDDFVAIESDLTSFGAPGTTMSKQLLITAKAAHRSMLSNHPDITLAEVRRLIDVRNMQQVMQAMIAMNELTPAKPGESSPASR